MVDLESHKLVDMIESREMNDVLTWLEKYPNIQIVSRDGSRTYANAISEAHPKAIQISDRFHLIKNLNDYATRALQKIFQGRVAIPVTDETRRYRMIMLLGNVEERAGLVQGLRKNGHTQSEIMAIFGVSDGVIKKLMGMPKIDICAMDALNLNHDIAANQTSATKQTVRGREHDEAVKKLQDRAELVRALKHEGLNLSQISRKTGFTYHTIRNYLSDNFSPINAHYGKQIEGKLEPFRNEALHLKSKGLKYREIHAIIKEKGYAGTQDAIRGFISKERRIHQNLSSLNTGHEEFIDKKWLIRLLYKPVEELRGISHQQLESIFQKYPLFKSILDIVYEFKSTLKSKNPNNLHLWMNKASTLGVAELKSFVEGLKSDIDAVCNAIIYDYNNGLAEGTINKIKVIKRIMYGRCQFPLLRSKCLMLSGG